MTDVNIEVDLYDHEIKKVGSIIGEATRRFAKRRATKQNVSELEKYLVDQFHKIGLVVQVHTVPVMLGVGPMAVTITNRVEGHDDFKVGHDHERHGWEVKKSVDRGEDAKIRSALGELYREGYS